MGRKPLHDPSHCHCGSGEPWFALHDASGIYVARVCDVCEPSVRARYRPEIFTDSDYDCDELKEPEEF